MPEITAVTDAAKIDWSKVAEEKISGGLSRRVVQTSHFTLAYYTYPAGATFKLHQHPEAQLTYVIRGKIAFDIKGEKTMLVAGDWLYIPGDVPHSARAGTSGPVVAINIFSPRRTDFPDAR